MRVMMVLNSYEQDGPGQLVRALCDRLRDERGLQLCTVALSRGGPLREVFEDLRIPTTVLGVRPHRGWGRLRAWARALAQDEKRPDLIHTHLLWPDLALRLVRHHLPGVPLVATNHGLHAAGEKGLWGEAYNVLERLTRQRHDHWVAVSNQVAESLVEAGYPRAAVTAIPNGVSALVHFPRPAHQCAEMRWMLDLQPGQKLVVAAGNLRPVKGHKTLFDAMPAIRSQHPGVRLVLVGSGPLRGDLLAHCAYLGIDEAVRIINPLGAMLPELLSAADVVAVPSRYESFGLVAAEAGACGTPVVATRVGGLAEVVADGVTGYLVDEGDSVAMASRISDLLEDAELRQRMGRKARQHIVENYEVGTTARGYLDLWLRLTGLELAEPEEDAGDEFLSLIGTDA